MLNSPHNFTVKYDCSSNNGGCENGASCTAEHGLITCSCTEGWGGPFCGDGKFFVTMPHFLAALYNILGIEIILHPQPG